MRVVIGGGTGLLGRRLAASLAGDGHDVVVLSRRPQSKPAVEGSPKLVAWTPNGDVGGWASALEGAHAVVNLAGESLATGRWSAARKRAILDSRVLATRSLARAVSRANSAVFVSGSAVGYYGALGDEIATEDHPPGSDFLATVCQAWEAETDHAGPDTRVVRVRTGLALDQEGGALQPMLLPFRLFAGGPVGSGRQYWPWIHWQDWIGLVRWAIETPAVQGPLNATAPNPVRNAEFARALGRALHRPAFVPTPAFALKLLLGEMAEALVLAGQRAVPAKAERLGYTFKYPQLDPALASIFSR